jgi:hypothetical protein
LAFVANAYCAPDSTVRVSKAVTALRKAVLGMTDGDVNSVVNLFAPLQMRVIGANDATWKRDNPNWSPVLHLISNDLKKDLEPALAEQNATNAVRWDRELATHLSPAQIDKLLAFYHSDVGRRYLAFQRRLIVLQSEANSAFVTGMASGGLDLMRVAASTPSATQLEVRKNLVALSWVFQVTHAMGVAASPSHGANAGDDKAINDMMVDAVAKMRGPELDALHHKYQDDLPAFSTFQESPTAKALLAVYGNVTKDSSAEGVKPNAALMVALQQSVALHNSAWRAAYEAGRANAR